VEAQRAAGRAALALHKIGKAAAHYRFVLVSSPIGTDAEFAALETELGGNDNIFGARQLADRLASSFPSSGRGLRVQGFTALRADDPAAAVQDVSRRRWRCLPASVPDENARRDLQQSLARARIMAGDAEAPLAQAQENAQSEAIRRSIASITHCC
jgi:hypothetical protein